MSPRIDRAANRSRRLLIDRMKTPIGMALLVSDRDGFLRAFDWEEHEARMRRFLDLQNGPVEIEVGRAAKGVRAALADYFAGRLDRLATIPWRAGGTAFQRRVWAALPTIPAGQTLSYGALADRIGAPQAIRAVGAANGANPLSVVVPCHRLIGADGSLTGYGGGLERKRWLLRHEGALP